MQKIMFDDRFGLTAAVYEGRKKMTRRPARKKYIKDADGNLSWKWQYRQEKKISARPSTDAPTKKNLKQKRKEN